MSAERIYIAGPVRGLPDHNFPAFRAAAGRLRSVGWTVVSPVEIGERLFGNAPDVPGGEYIRADIRELAACDAIALLPGWERSTGARCEAVVAATIGLRFVDGLTGGPMSPPSRIVCNGGYEQLPGAVDTLDSLADEIRPWQRATFPKATPASIAEHLRREAVELCRNPTDVEEMADIFFLLVGASDGIDLAGAVRAKLEKNRRRVWGVPDADGVVEHIPLRRVAP